MKDRPIEMPDGSEQYGPDGGLRKNRWRKKKNPEEQGDTLFDQAEQADDQAKPRLREELFDVKRVDFLGEEYTDPKSALFVNEPNILIRELTKKLDKDPDKAVRLETELKKMLLARELRRDPMTTMEEGYAKVFLSYSGIHVLNRPKVPSLEPIAYPYNVDKKRALCYMLAQDRGLFIEALVGDLIDHTVEYLKKRMEKITRGYQDHRPIVGTGLDTEIEKAGSAFLREYDRVARDARKNDIGKEENNLRKFILMLALAATYRNLKSTFAARKSVLREYGIVGNIQDIDPQETVDGKELKYWSGGYFHSRFELGKGDGISWKFIRNTQ